jgi:dermatan 4-sulfotransferase 1
VTDSELAALIAAAARTGRLNIEDTWVSGRRRYFYMAVEKAASSKIKMLLHQLEGYALPADPFDVHARNRPGMPFVDKLSAFGADATAEILRGPDWFRFAFARNPYARLYSAYKNKIADLASPYVGVRTTIWRMAGNPQPPAEAAPFEAFVRYVAQQPDAQRDGHWRSQAGALCLDLIAYGFVGRVETLQADLSTVLRSLGAPEDFHDGLDVVVGASAGSPTASAYNADLAHLVHETYEADFEIFGYLPDSWRDAV